MCWEVQVEMSTQRFKSGENEEENDNDEDGSGVGSGSGGDGVGSVNLIEFQLKRLHLINCIVIYDNIWLKLHTCSHSLSIKSNAQSQGVSNHHHNYSKFSD